MNIFWVGALGNNAVINTKYTGKATESLKFSEALSNRTKVISTDIENQTDKYFPNMKVSVKTGNCDIPKSNWNRNDFPFRHYFKKNTKADSLNYWKPTGAEPGEAAWRIQKELKQIEFGAISILIPDSLQQKMDADPKYAEQIWESLSEWKNNYDSMDNAIAASYGLNTFIHQMSKSYCIQLNKNGNVENHVVVSGGLDYTNYSQNVTRENYCNRRLSPDVTWKTSNILHSIHNDSIHTFQDNTGYDINFTAADADICYPYTAYPLWGLKSNDKYRGGRYSSSSL